MPQLSRKIRLVFVIQALVAALLVTIGTLVGGAWLSKSILGARISQEAVSVWEDLERDPGLSLPHSTAFLSYFVPRVNGDDSAVPEVVRQLPAGVHRVRGDYRMAYVGERPAGRLYLLMAPSATDRIVSGLSLLAILLSLAAISLVSWLGYKRCKRVIAPVSRLAGRVAHWDPRDPDRQSFHAPVAAGGDQSSEVESLGRALDDMATRMAEHMRRETNFTRDASHEFRTPLTVIRVASDLLEHEQDISERGRRSLHRIASASRDMEEVLEALLILARDPALPVESVDVPVLEIVEEQAALARMQLRDKPVTVDVDVEQVPVVQAPLRVLGVMLGQLLRNACDFTEAGRIAVRLAADRIEVSDTGIGMDEGTMQRVFEPFFRADISNPRAKGMGLPVVQRLAERFEWQLQLHSQPGTGTRVVIVFPAAEEGGQPRPA